MNLDLSKSLKGYFLLESICPTTGRKELQMFRNKFMPLFDIDEAPGNADVTGQVTDQATMQVAMQAESTEDGTAQPQAIEPRFKLNFLGEEKEVGLEEAKTLAQKGLNYDPIKEKWETSKTKLNAFDEIARKAGFINADGHGDLDAYCEAAREQLRQREIEELTNKVNLSPELAEELYQSRQELEQWKAEKEQQKAEAEKQKQYAELLDFYREVHGKDFDPATTKLPNEVWKAVEQGVQPKYAYAEYLTKELTRKEAVDKANLENSEASPGGVSGKGTAVEQEFFTSEELDKLTDKDLDNPNIYEKAMRSLSKLGR